MIRGFWTALLWTPMVFAQTSTPCTLEDWRMMLRTSIHQDRIVDLQRCSNLSKLVNEDLGFGQRALHWAVLAEKWPLVLQLLELPDTSLSLCDDDKSFPFELFLTQSIDPPQAVFRVFWAKAGNRLAHASLIELASECMEPLGAMVERKERIFQWAMEIARETFPYGDIFFSLLRADIRCPAVKESPQSPMFLDTFWDDMSESNRHEIEEAVFDELIMVPAYSGYLKTPSRDEKLFRIFLLHPRLDRDFPTQASREEKDRYSLRARAAAFIGDEASVRYLVERRHYPINYQDQGNHALLFEALRSGDDNFIQAFLDLPDLDVTLRESDGRTALFIVLERHLDLAVVERIVARARATNALDRLLEAKNTNELTVVDYIRGRKSFLRGDTYEQAILTYLEGLSSK